MNPLLSNNINYRLFKAGNAIIGRKLDTEKIPIENLNVTGFLSYK